MWRRIIFAVIASAVWNYPLHAGNRWWIFFTDKGPQSHAASLERGSTLYERTLNDIDPRAVERREKVLPQTDLIDSLDLPIYQPYRDSLKSLGICIHVESRWFNAVTAELDSTQRAFLQHLSFVRSIEPVAVFQRTEPALPEFLSKPQHSSSKGAISRTGAALDYGPSLEQIRFHDIERLHQLGIVGKDVLVGMLDTGFRWRTNEALHNADVKAEYDFVQEDSITANQAPVSGQQYPDYPAQDNHGTETFSVIAAYAPGELIGGAYGASFVLAKTEYVPTETRIEEDNWVAGIEWMERLGVQVVSSSLGYNVFDDGTGYFYSHGDFNGRTAKTSIAAAIAARKGVLVVTAMGNENSGNSTPQLGTLLTPADADSIVAVGAVDSLGRFARFSSCGPTNDGRTKPEVSAMGIAVYSVSFAPNTPYYWHNGTSFATPLVASISALIFSARPELTPMEVRAALMNTARHVSDPLYTSTWPNNYYGWGIADAYNAVLSFPGPVFSNRPEVSFQNGRATFSIAAVSRDSVPPLRVSMIYWGRSQDQTLNLFPASESGWFSATISNLGADDTLFFYFTAVDGTGNSAVTPARAPARFYRFTTRDASVALIDTTKPPSYVPTLFKLYQNYPNPFNAGTNIQVDVPQAGHLTVEIWNVLGQRVRTLFDNFTSATVQRLFWDGKDDRGMPLASGIYFVRAVMPNFSQTIKMVLVH